MPVGIGNPRWNMSYNLETSAATFWESLCDRIRGQIDVHLGGEFMTLELPVNGDDLIEHAGRVSQRVNAQGNACRAEQGGTLSSENA